jgi:hypothetical protein
MPSSIASIYADRCRLDTNGHLVPTFWNPTDLAKEPMCVYSDRRRPTSPEWQAVVKRIISLGLGLEVEVGGYVLQGLTKKLPNAGKYLLPLLKSNASDESRHFKGFQFAEAQYGSEGDVSSLARVWGAKTLNQHPIFIAGLLEAGVFLVSLGLLRVFGGPSLTRLAMQIAEDENRHVVTNVAVAKAVGAWSPGYEGACIDMTLEWIMGGWYGEGDWTIDNLKRWSRELMIDRESPQFDKLTWYTTHTPPFEVDNNHLYTSREA